MAKIDALLESKSLRDEYANYTNILNKVKALVLLPDDMHATVDMTARYYEVPVDAIEAHIRNNRDELEQDGMVVLTGTRLSAFKTETGISSRAGSLTIISRRAILRIGMLLRDSEVAKAVRTALLNMEAVARKQAPHVIKEAMDKQDREARMHVMLMNAQTRRAKLIFDATKEFKERLSAVAIESMISVATEMLAGKEIVPRPQTEKLYTASEIGAELGISANKVGRTAEKHGIKTAEYGVLILDKSPHSTKQVSSFRYNEKGFQKIKELLESENIEVKH